MSREESQDSQRENRRPKGGQRTARGNRSIGDKGKITVIAGGDIFSFRVACLEGTRLEGCGGWLSGAHGRRGHLGDDVVVCTCD